MCDEDRGDLDLRLRDPGGEQVAKDKLLDAHPVLLLTPVGAGEFTLAVDLIECSVEPCYWKVLASSEGAN